MRKAGVSGYAVRGVLFLSILLCAGPVFGKGKGTFLEGTFSGTIGKSRVSMKLWRSLPQRFGRFSLLDSQFPRLQRLEGFYYYERYKEDILLLGYFDEQGNWTISEYAEPGVSPTGLFKGSLKEERFEGRWETPDGRRSVKFELIEIKKELRTGQEAMIVSREDEELAAQSTKDKDFPKAIFFLTLSRLAGSHSIETQNWEALFQTLLDGKREEFKEKLASCRKTNCSKFVLTQGPLGFLAEQDGDFSNAKRLYRGLCVPPRLYFQPITFNCLVYAALGERTGDRRAALEGYDLACQRTKSMCGKASGADEAQLIAAVREKDFDVAEKLLEKPINVNANNGGALLYAVLAGDFRLVQTLVEKGADPNLSNGQILETAIKNNHEDIANFLLDCGADPNISDMGGSHALCAAVEKRSIPLIEKLISKGADVNENDYVGGGTPLLCAAEDNQLEIVKVLLDHGADPTIEAKFHGSPIQATSDPEIKKILSEAIASCRSGARKCESTN